VYLSSVKNKLINKAVIALLLNKLIVFDDKLRFHPTRWRFSLYHSR